MTTNAGMCVGRRNIYPLPVGVQIGAVTVEITVKVLPKLEIDIAHLPAMPSLGLYPEDSIHCCRNTCLSMLIAALFTIARK